MRGRRRIGRIAGASAVAVCALLVGLIGADTSGATAVTQESGIDCTDTSQPVGPLLALAQATVFDNHRDATGYQRLTVKRPGRPDLELGPEGWIYPADNSIQHNDNALEDGKIVAKIEIGPDPGGDQGYAKLSLPPGTSYVAICRTGPGNSPRYTALIIPEDLSQGLRTHRVRWHRAHPKGRAHARARWQYDPTDDKACMTCSRTGWCELY